MKINDTATDETEFQLPTPAELKRLIALSDPLQAQILQQRQTIAQILDQQDPRLLVIVGPCSIHDTTAALEFASRLRDLQEEVSEELFLVMRVYCEKPRSSLGWKGMLYDPHLNESHEIRQGIHLCRELMLQIQQMGVPFSTEFLDPLTYAYYSDLVSMGSIGARTSTSQTHRQMASHLDFPMTFKNPVDGNVRLSVESMKAAAHPQAHLFVSEEGLIKGCTTRGNPNTVLVLRGSIESSNYDEKSIEEARKLLKEHQLRDRLVIDCSHGNSRKNPLNQEKVLRSALQHVIEENHPIVGVMMESHLEGGSQKLSHAQLNYGQSITDPCLSWAETEQILLSAAETLRLSPVRKDHSYCL